ncbi:MAG: Branched-chain amino acid aminotransferase [uncultured Thermomicrobiales bacterium]|uniref:Branched-chain-amino-acid aminotransferase n=1 Tax=uncultured Thermomicrobiales bacterium TaxID=1645740 RepID=A0A6J4UPH9_9BACT|nr:MAG: Branched-chain amino acid aminotransferase [uncultured Thermomicrobiales bacterium]
MASSKHPSFVWWRGERVAWDDATVHVTDLGWSTVGAVFEGIRGYWDDRSEQLYVFRLDEHLERLVSSCRLVRLPLRYSAAELREATLELIRANDSREDTYIRPMVYLADTSGKRGAQIEQNAEVLINTNTMPSHLQTGMAQRVCVSSWTRISDNVMPPRAKNFSNYRNGQLATMEARLDGYDSAIMLNDRRQVSELPGACLMMVHRGKLITPDPQQSILESITRDALIRLAREELGIEVVERAIDRTELYVADEIFSCGTAAEITPIVDVDHYQVGDGVKGPITTRLEQVFHDVLRGREQRYAHWRTPVHAAVAVGV